MPGLPDYTATGWLNWMTGIEPLPAIASRYLGLFTSAPTSDSGVTGASEVSGGSYARVQVAGALTVSGSSGAPSTASTTITLSANAPAWLAALGTGGGGGGVTIYDSTGSVTIGTIATNGASSSSPTITMLANSLHNGSLSDTLLFSAFPLATASVGAEPTTQAAQVQNGAAINFAASTGSWGTVTSWGLFDASTSGNCLWWDYLGAFHWSPFTCTLASPSVLTCVDQSFTNGQFAVVSTKTSGSLTGTWTGILTVAGVSGSTFNLGVNASAAGDGLVRQVAELVIGTSTTVTFSPNQLTLTLS